MHALTAAPRTPLPPPPSPPSPRTLNPNPARPSFCPFSVLAFSVCPNLSLPSPSTPIRALPPPPLSCPRWLQCMPPTPHPSPSFEPYPQSLKVGPLAGCPHLRPSACEHHAGPLDPHPFDFMAQSFRHQSLKSLKLKGPNWFLMAFHFRSLAFAAES